MGVRQRFRAQLTWQKLPGHLIYLFGIAWEGIWRLSDIGGRLDFLSRIVEGLGGTPAVIAAAILSPWAGGALIVAGISYVVFVGEPERGVQRHHWWPYVGWLIFATAFVAVSFVFISGALEIYGRREYEMGRTGAPRGTPDENTPTHPQRPLFTGDRSITPDQTRILLDEFSKLKSTMPSVVINIPANDNESYILRRQFDDILRRVGIHPTWGEQNPRGLDDVGLMIAVKDVSHPPAEAQKFREALDVANIHTRYVDYDLNPNDPFAFFIGPRPIN